jgi:hypothetical protein
VPPVFFSTLIRGQIFPLNYFPPCRSRSLPDLVLLRDLFLCLQDFAAAYLSFSFPSPALGQVKLPALFPRSQFSGRLEFSLHVDPAFSPALKFFARSVHFLLQWSTLFTGHQSSLGASLLTVLALRSAGVPVWCSVQPLFPSPNLILVVLCYAVYKLLQGDAGIALESSDQKTRELVV